MPIRKFQFRPGINKETTSYVNEGGWFDADKVRFRFGYPETIGGWQKLSDDSFLGTCRSLHPWRALDGSHYISVGTHLKYYIQEGGIYNDITPIRTTSSAGNLTFSAAANTLDGAISDADTTVTLSDASGFPPFGYVQVDSETIFYRNVNGNDLENCDRGVDDTTAASHTDTTAVNCATITASLNNHDAVTNAFVTIASANGLGGNITASVLNQEYQLAGIDGNTTFFFHARSASTSISDITEDGQLNPSLVFANSSDTGDGGSSTTGEFQINPGLDTTTAGGGWGAGTWGRGPWGSGVSSTAVTEILRIWSQDNFGEDLLMNIRDGGIYYWDKTDGLNTRAIELKDVTNADSTTPTVAKQVLVSDRDRHVIVFGCDPESDIGTQDPLLIRFGDQESLNTWQSLPTNTAGELRIGTGTEIMAAVETRQQTLVFTDMSLHSMQFLGPPHTFGIEQIATHLTIAGPLAAQAVGDTVYWMGLENFYVYRGQVQRIPCPLRDHVFNDFNNRQLPKVHAALNSTFNEIWWFYPSANSEDIDRYVIYNYQDQTWSHGTLHRTAWIDRNIVSYPLAVAADHRLYYHEYGLDDGTTNPKSPILAHIESSEMDLEDGHRFAFIRRILPDLKFGPSTNSTTFVTMTLKARNFSGADISSTDSGKIEQTAVATLERFTDQAHVRLRGRSFRIRVESDQTGTFWRLGDQRIDLRPDGRRA